MPAPDRRLLFFSPLLAMPSQHGGCVYPHALLTELARQGFAIDYAWLGSPLQNGRRWMRNPLQSSYVSNAWVRDTLRLGSFLIPSSLRGWLGKSETLPFNPRENGSEHTATPAEKAFAQAVIRRVGARAVLIDSTPMLTLLDGLPAADRARLHVAVLTHNLTYRRSELYRAHGQPLDFLPMTRPDEAALLARADTVVAIQEREAETFREMLPGKRVITVPMPFAPQPQPRAAEIPGRCLFVGGFSGHNIEAVSWLLRDIWPLVRRENPRAELVVAGTVGRSVKQAPDGVKIAGAVADLKHEYAATSVCLVPLPLGTGLKIKLVEAMGFGRAVVTTPSGAEGFTDLEQGRGAAVASTPAEFARAVTGLLVSESARSARIAQQFDCLERLMSPPIALGPLVSAFSETPPP